MDRSHRRSRRHAVGVLGRRASSKQPARSGRNLKSLRRGAAAGYFDKPITTRLRVRIPPTTQVVVAQRTERWITLGPSVPATKGLCCGEEFGRRESQTSRRFAPGPEGEKKQKMKSECKAMLEPFADSIGPRAKARALTHPDCHRRS